MSLFTPSVIAAFLSEMKGENTVAYDLRKRSSYTDYALITEGVSAPHVRAMAEKLYRAIKETGIVPRYDGRMSALPGWAVIDTGLCLVHIILAEKREFYALDRLYEGARKIKC